MKYFNCLKVLLNLYLILFFLFGWTGPVLAQEASSSAQQITQAVEDLVESFKVPKLPLPFNSEYTIIHNFADSDSENIMPKLVSNWTDQRMGLVEFNFKQSSDILAVDEGVVESVEQSGFGSVVTIDHKWGQSVYGLVKEVKVSKGDKISKSQQIAQSISSNQESLFYFGIKPKIPILDSINGYIDPLTYLPDTIKADENKLSEIKEARLQLPSQSDGGQATNSAAVLGDTQQEQATASASIQVKADNIASDSAYLFNYKFDLNKGTTAHFYDKATQRPSFAIADKDYNYKLRFFLNQDNIATDSGHTPKVEGNRVEFPVVVKGIPMTLRYTIDQNRVKEEFVIQNKPPDELLASQGETLQIPFTTSTVGLTREKKEQGYEFKSDTGDIVWRVLNPTIEDNQGKKGTSNEINLDIQDNQAILGVKTEFLKSASYPIIIDPTWTQTDWSGGSGQTSWSDATKYDSSSSVTTSTAGQFSLTNSEKLSNTDFETNLTSWNTGEQPSTVSGLQFWVKADAITGLSDGAAVSSWVDSSGNSNTATQGTAAKQPVYKTNIINSQPVVRFVGTSVAATGDDLKIPITNGTGLRNVAGGTMIIVSKMVLRGTSNPQRPISVLGATGLARMGIVAEQTTANKHELATRRLDSDSTTFIGSGAADYSASSFYILGGIADYSGGNRYLYRDGALLASTTGLSTGNTSDTAPSANPTVGAEQDIGTQFLNGDIAEAMIFNAAISSTDRSRIENYLRDKYSITVSSGITSATRDTTTTYSSSAGSAKLVTSSTDTGEFTQTVNVGDTNTYNLSAYAYTDGSAVTSSDVQLFYNGSTVSTTYTLAGGGWYQLTGTVTGANASRVYGVQVQANKTVYVDNMSLNGYASSGTLTSSIFDTGQRSDWGTLTYNATTPANTSVSVKVRSSDSSSMSGATDFSSCSAVTSGSDISSNSCVTDSHRYLQYQVSLSSTDTATSTPTFQDLSVTYSETTPIAPSGFSGSAAGTTSITWSWTDNSSDEDGFYVQDTSGNTKCTVSSANTTTCTETGLSPGTTYTRNVVAFNSGGNSSASSNASATTRTVPAPSLDSPSDSSYTNSSRPSFKFQTPTDNSSTKTYSDVASYKLTIADSSSTYITVSGIPASRTTDYDGGTYLAHYDGFSDSDITNNYITIYTKSSSSWSSTSNDGNLKEGKNTWSVASVDSSGNESAASRIIYADYTSPVISNLSSSDTLGAKDGYLILTNTTPNITGTITDNLALNKVDLSFFQEHYFLGVLNNTTLEHSQTYTLTSADNNTDFSLDLTSSQDLGFGSFRVDVIAYDRAGNKSQSSLKIKIMTATQAQELLTGQIAQQQQTTTSLTDLEKQALLRRQIEAGELQKFLTAIGDALLALYNEVSYLASNLGISLDNIVNYLAQIFNTQAQNIIAYVNNVWAGLGNAYQNTIGFWLPEKVNSLIACIFRSIGNLNQLAMSILNRSQDNVSRQIAITQKDTTDQFIAFSHFFNYLQQALTNSQATVKDKIADTHKDSSQRIFQASEGIKLAFRSLRKPVSDAADFMDRLRVGADTFVAIVFDKEPTRIADVTIEEIGKDYAVISWKTNHYATGKVNYGKDLTYGNEVVLEKREKYHQARLTDLKPGQRIFFEVMSQNKNYAYDAYYSFQTIGD